jgi:hypothetical protein
MLDETTFGVVHTFCLTFPFRLAIMSHAKDAEQTAKVAARAAGKRPVHSMRKEK